MSLVQHRLDCKATLIPFVFLCKVSLKELSPSRARANVSRAGVYQGSACGTELVRSGVVRDYPSQEPRGVRGLRVGLLGASGVREFSESGLRWLSLSGVELFLPPSPEFELSFSCLPVRIALSSANQDLGVELFLPPSPEFVSSVNQDLGGCPCQSGVREFSESGLRWLSLSGVELFLPPSPEFFPLLFLPSPPVAVAWQWLLLGRSQSLRFFSILFMVRTKALAKAYITCHPGPSSSDSEYFDRVKMGKKASTSDFEAITKLSVAKISSRKVPCSPEGLWVENLGYFVTKSEEIEDSFYYRSIRSGYAR
ncbi:hypothetical protein AgCh_031324 [Apium graveolens]